MPRPGWEMMMALGNAIAYSVLGIFDAWIALHNMLLVLST
jgi:hypothetical protein